MSKQRSKTKISELPSTSVLLACRRARILSLSELPGDLNKVYGKGGYGVEGGREEGRAHARPGLLQVRPEQGTHSATLNSNTHVVGGSSRSLNVEHTGSLTSSRLEPQPLPEAVLILPNSVPPKSLAPANPLFSPSLTLLGSIWRAGC